VTVNYVIEKKGQNGGTDSSRNGFDRSKFSTGRVKHLRPSKSDDLADRDQGRVDIVSTKSERLSGCFSSEIAQFYVAAFQVLHHHSIVLGPKMTSSTT
jgi:hypothetical protein